MPKLVDYAARFEFLREAAFAVVLEGNPSNLSRQALADTLGMSLSTVRRLITPEATLTGLAAQAVERRRAHGRWGVPRSEDHLQNAARLISSLIPSTVERVGEERVWLKLILLHPDVTPPQAREDVRARYQLFDRDWSDPPRAPEPTRDDASVARHIAEREAFLRQRLYRTLDELDVQEAARPAAFRRLRAFVDGLTLDVCLAHLTPEEGIEQAEEMVQSLSRVEQ